MAGPVRKSVIAGSWYPGNQGILRDNITMYLESASIPSIPRKPVAIISPHAGYMYSGKVAAFAYKTILNYTYSTVVVISPSHRSHFPFVSIWPQGSYETPLGQIEVDEEFCTELVALKGLIEAVAGPHIAEHALEIQLPFLQTCLKSFKLCPLIMGQQDLHTCENLARILHTAIKNPDDVLIVASSDLSHFHPAKNAQEMDGRIAKHIEDFNISGLSKDLENSHSEACGGGPILATLQYAKALSRTNTKVLCYAHSGDITGDNNSVVGYLAAVVY